MSTTVLFLTSVRDGSYLRGIQITLPHTDFALLPNLRLPSKPPSPPSAAASSPYPPISRPRGLYAPHKGYFPQVWPELSALKVGGFLQPLSIKIQSKGPLTSNGQQKKGKTDNSLLLYPELSGSIKGQGRPDATL